MTGTNWPLFELVQWPLVDSAGSGLNNETSAGDNESISTSLLSSQWKSLPRPSLSWNGERGRDWMSSEPATLLAEWFTRSPSQMKTFGSGCLECEQLEHNDELVTEHSLCSEVNGQKQQQDDEVVTVVLWRWWLAMVDKSGKEMIFMMHTDYKTSWIFNKEIIFMWHTVYRTSPFFFTNFDMKYRNRCRIKIYLTVTG